MKRRKAIYEYGRHYHRDKFAGWRVWRVPPKDADWSAVAEFFGKKAKTRAKEFAKKLNQETIG
jgi:hypothetical protein